MAGKRKKDDSHGWVRPIVRRNLAARGGSGRAAHLLTELMVRVVTQAASGREKAVELTTNLFFFFFFLP